MMWGTLGGILLLVGGAVCVPHSPREKFAHALHRRTGDCTTLTRATDRFVNFVVVNYMAREMPPGVPRQLIQRATGVDIAHPEEMHTVICTVTQATSLQELRAALDTTGVTYNAFRFTYDYLVVTYHMARRSMDHGGPGLPDSDPHSDYVNAVTELLDIVEQSGLLQLDPEGVAWIYENVIPRRPDYDDNLGGNRGPMVKRQGSLCDQAVTQIQILLDATVFHPDNEHFEEHIVQTIQQWSGINIRNSDQIRSLVCQALEISSLQGALDFLDANGLDQAERMAYPMLVQQLAQLYEHQQNILQQIESGEAAPWVIRAGQFARVFVPLYEALQASGLLSLST